MTVESLTLHAPATSGNPASAPVTPQTFRQTIPLDAGWAYAFAPCEKSTAQLGDLQFVPAQIPGTAASILRAQKAWRLGDGTRFDDGEHWFRCTFDSDPVRSGEEIVLQFGGIATVAEVWLNGQPILRSNSMFAPHAVEVTTLLKDRNELLIACRSLSAAMREYRRKPPMARWKTRVVADQPLRWMRTTLLGRAPGFAPEPAPVGPWRPVSLLRRSKIAIENRSREVILDGSAGLIQAHFSLRSLQSAVRPVGGRIFAGDANAPITIVGNANGSSVDATLRIPNVRRWWPHTHGEPYLYPLRIEIELSDGSVISSDEEPVGFRSLDPGAEPAGDGGLALSVNGTRVFCRGVVWTPPDPVALYSPRDVLRERLTLLRDGGFNLIRLAGTMVYESGDFHSLCDELGLLVWQDMMFANMDYPFANPEFHETVAAEARTELSRLARHPSTAVICGNSEIEQQAAMLGLDPSIARGSFFGVELPSLAREHCPGVPYVPSAPCGGDLPFRSRDGVANYFGVGAYLRPLEDARRAQVRFASECLAFSNVPEPEMLEQMALATPGGSSPTHPAWKRGIPRDAGTGWDFEDIRDYYLNSLYAVDPFALRYADTPRYWELSRMVTGDVMAGVFGEWRRAKSGCGGGIVLWSADLEPGAGWGILDSQGRPKAAYWFLKRALAPCAIWTTDEGLNGVDIHAANDRAEPSDVWLRVALYRSAGDRVGESEIEIRIPGHETVTFGVEKLLGRFCDAAGAYRFGPPGHDLIAVSLHDRRGDVPFAQSFRQRACQDGQRAPISDLGIDTHATYRPDGTVEILLSSVRFAWGVRVAAAGWRPDDSYFGIEPGGKRRIVMTPLPRAKIPSAFSLTAVNAEGYLPIAFEDLE